MNQPGRFIVIDKDGVRGTLERLPSPQASAAEAQVTVQLENGQRVIVPARALLERECEDGTFFLSRGFAELGTDASTDVNSEPDSLVVPVMEEEVEVERVAINRIVDRPLPVRHEGDTIIVPLLEEVLVVEKRLVLKEELRITKRQHKTRKPQRVTLRREEVRVERLDSSEQQRGKDKGGQPTSAASSK
ncbi:MAG TPA: DUF2382 domain-containing protein [Gammaproteobacteria bacterium]|nr:DUF2382 domain-containing protein [Gammaproteobacteria bacterium]